MAFYLGLFVFIISVVVGLIVLIAGKGLKNEKFLLLVTIHFLLLLASLAFFAIKKNESGQVNFFFMLLICSGLILSGLAWRSAVSKYFRYYFTLYMLSIPLFLISPSQLMNFLLTASFTGTHEPLVHLEGRYFLEKQNTSRKKNDTEYYKLILKKGMFHQTIQRDITFGNKLDSAKVIEFIEGQNMVVRGYTSVVTHVSSDIDSSDQTLQLLNKKAGEIEYKVK
jgi:Ca2+/Na+ antiporter